MPNKIDLTGQRFGKLTVISESDKRGNGGTVYWLCQCDCGNTVLRTSKALRKGYTTSCGCNSITDLTGEHFGMLTVLERTEQRRHRSYVWKCRCDCGNICYYSLNELKSGCQSCGCKTKIHMKNVHAEYFNHNTQINKIKSDKPAKNNTSGKRGVSWNRFTQKWVACIMFQRKRYYLGSYNDLQEAISARKQAEEHIYGEFLKWYEENKKSGKE